MIVRNAEERDLEPLLRLYAQLNPDDPPLPRDRSLERLWQTMLREPRNSIFVGDSDGLLVATCTLTIVLNLTRGARPYGFIENVVTERDHRRRGYGRRLLHHAMTMAWEQGCYKVMVLTGSKRQETIRFYEGSGFRAGVKNGFVALAPRRN